jgi:hypothetical protein
MNSIPNKTDTPIRKKTMEEVAAAAQELVEARAAAVALKEQDDKAFNDLRAVKKKPRIGKGSQEFRLTLEYVALKTTPQPATLDRFEGLTFRERQGLLARLNRLQSTVNLKPLPAAIASLTVGIATAAVFVRSLEGKEGFYEILTVIFFLLGVLGIALLFAMPRYTQKDSCLTSWTEAFKDSHALQTKKEEEKRKDDKDKVV